MYCSKCGVENADGSQFCNKCGAAIGQSVPETNNDALKVQIKETGQMIKGSFIISIVSFILLIVCIANIGPGGVRGNVDDVMIIIVLFVFLIASFALGFYNWFKKEKLDKKLK